MRDDDGDKRLHVRQRPRFCIGEDARFVAECFTSGRRCGLQQVMVVEDASDKQRRADQRVVTQRWQWQSIEDVSKSEGHGDSIEGEREGE